MVFLHYFGGAAESWQWVAEALSATHRCVAINLPGFGNVKALKEPSIHGMAENVLQTLEQLEISDCALVGHSMGGKIALQVAAKANESIVKQLVLLAPSPPSIERMPAPEKERMLHHPNLAEAKKTVQQVTVAPLTVSRYALAVDTQLRIDQKTWRWWIQEGMDLSIIDQIPRLTVGVTVLASKDDPAITYEMINEEVMPYLPQANLITTARVGHLLPLECPEWVARQLQEILAD